MIVIQQEVFKGLNSLSLSRICLDQIQLFVHSNELAGLRNKYSRRKLLSLVRKNNPKYSDDEGKG